MKSIGLSPSKTDGIYRGGTRVNAGIHDMSAESVEDELCIYMVDRRTSRVESSKSRGFVQTRSEDS